MRWITDRLYWWSLGNLAENSISSAPPPSPLYRHMPYFPTHLLSLCVVTSLFLPVSLNFHSCALNSHQPNHVNIYLSINLVSYIAKRNPVSNNNEKYSNNYWRIHLHYITYITLLTLHYLHYITYITLLTLHYLHYITYITLLTLQLAATNLLQAVSSTRWRQKAAWNKFVDFNNVRLSITYLSSYPPINLSIIYIYIYIYI